MKFAGQRNTAVINVNVNNAFTTFIHSSLLTASSGSWLFILGY